MKIALRLFGGLIALLLVCVMSCSKKADPGPSVALPKISISDVTAAEGNAMIFTISMDSISTDTVSVSWLASAITATSDDYISFSTKFTAFIFPGQKSTLISVFAKSDALAENDETFEVNLSDAKHATILDDKGIGTITNVTSSGPPLSDYFMKAKIDGVQWTSIIGGFFGAEMISNTFAGYGLDGDSQLSFVFYQSPTGTKTYGIEELGASSDANVSVYYSPHFFSQFLTGPVWNGQPGGEFKITSFNTSTHVAEGTFHFTGHSSSGNDIQITEGSFKVPVSE